MISRTNAPVRRYFPQGVGSGGVSTSAAGVTAGVGVGASVSATTGETNIFFSPVIAKGENPGVCDSKYTYKASSSVLSVGSAVHVSP